MPVQHVPHEVGQEDARRKRQVPQGTGELSSDLQAGVRVEMDRGGGDDEDGFVFHLLFFFFCIFVRTIGNYRTTVSFGRSLLFLAVVRIASQNDGSLRLGKSRHQQQFSDARLHGRDAQISPGVDVGPIVVQYQLHAGIAQIALSVEEHDWTRIVGVEKGGYEGRRWRL